MRRVSLCLVVTVVVGAQGFAEPIPRTDGQIDVVVRGQVTPAVVKAGEPIPLAVTVSNGLGAYIHHSTYSLTPNDWNGETHNISLVDIYRDGKEFNLYLARPKANPPHLVSGVGGRGIKAGESLRIETDARKWKLRDGWLPGHYKVIVRVDRLRIDPYWTLSVLSDPFEFVIEDKEPVMAAAASARTKDPVVTECPRPPEVVNGLRIELVSKVMPDGQPKLRISFENVSADPFDVIECPMFLEVQDPPEHWRAFQHPRWRSDKPGDVFTFEPGASVSEAEPISAFTSLSPGKHDVRISVVVDKGMASKYESVRIWTGMARSNSVVVEVPAPSSNQNKE